MPDETLTVDELRRLATCADGRAALLDDRSNPNVYELDPDTADLLVALAAAWRDVYVTERRLGHYCEPLLWTHDDLLSEVDTRYVLDVAPRLRKCLTTPPAGFSIPLETKPEAGLNWAEMVKL